MLPALPDIHAFRRLRRDPGAQRPAFEALARRHQLPVGELAPFSEGTHLVWGTDDHVVKVFIPLWPEDAEVELAMLDRLAGTDLPVPQLEAVGALGDYRYAVMTRLPGRSVGAVWPSLAPSERVSLAAEIGAQLAALHALTAPLALKRVDQEALLAERMPRVLDDQRDRGAEDALLDQLAAFLDGLGPLSVAEPVLLHADLTADHVLVENGRICGLIDFADAFVGPWTYELAAPAGFVTRGDRAAQQALLSGMGRTVATRAVHAWTVLHRYVHLDAMLASSGEPHDLGRWLATVWTPSEENL